MLKTDNYYNDDDFAQVGDQMNELTVTITLCEYRNMVRELARQDIEIERIQQESEDYKKKYDSLSGLILSKHKDEIAEIGKIALDIFQGGDESNDEESENDCAFWSDLDGTKKEAGTEAYTIHCTNCGGVPMYEPSRQRCLSKYCPHCGKYMGIKRNTGNGIETITAAERFEKKGWNDNDK